MELRDTIEMMCSEDYRERFRAEYWQTKVRYERLHRLIVQYEARKLPFELSCPIEYHREQAVIMREYLHHLEVRAELENIEL